MKLPDHRVLTCELRAECVGGAADGVELTVPGVTTRGSDDWRLFRPSRRVCWLVFDHSREGVMALFEPPFLDIHTHRYDVPPDLLHAHRGELPPVITLTP